MSKPPERGGQSMELREYSSRKSSAVAYSFLTAARPRKSARLRPACCQTCRPQRSVGGGGALRVGGRAEVARGAKAAGEHCATCLAAHLLRPPPLPPAAPRISTQRGFTLCPPGRPTKVSSTAAGPTLPKAPLSQSPALPPAHPHAASHAALVQLALGLRPVHGPVPAHLALHPLLLRCCRCRSPSWPRARRARGCLLGSRRRASSGRLCSCGRLLLLLLLGLRCPGCCWSRCRRWWRRMLSAAPAGHGRLPGTRRGRGVLRQGCSAASPLLPLRGRRLPTIGLLHKDRPAGTARVVPTTPMVYAGELQLAGAAPQPPKSGALPATMPERCLKERRPQAMRTSCCAGPAPAAAVPPAGWAGSPSSSAAAAGASSACSPSPGAAAWSEPCTRRSQAPRADSRQMLARNGSP